MAINLLDLEPHKISTDLRGYITYIYGEPKVGKTTLGSKMPKPLLLAFEKGYNAIANIYAQDITTWSEMKQVCTQLKKPQLKEKFATIIIDTVDIAAQLCEKYVCDQNDVDAIKDIAYGQGWTMLKREFETVLRSITQMGYAVYFISHAKEGTFKKQDGSEYSTVRPSVSTTYRSIIENMADLYGYMHPVIRDGVRESRITFRSEDGSVSAGSRFKYFPMEIGSTYDELVAALRTAIEMEAEEKGSEFVTDKAEVYVAPTELDFDKLMEEFNGLIAFFKDSTSEEEFSAKLAPRIVQITERYLGRGKKVSNCSREQVEMLSLIVADLKELKDINS
jgi:hypothetical protein